MTEQSLMMQRLKELHMRAGSPSSRRIAELAGKSISHATVAVTLSGKTVPSWAMFARIVTALNGNPEDFRSVWGAAHRNQKAEEFRKLYMRKPTESWKQCVINGQIHVWDDSPEWEFGQVWIPVCARCGSGPLMKGDTTNGLGLLCNDCNAFPE